MRAVGFRRHKVNLLAAVWEHFQGRHAWACSYMTDQWHCEDYLCFAPSICIFCFFFFFFVDRFHLNISKGHASEITTEPVNQKREKKKSTAKKCKTERTSPLNNIPPAPRLILRLKSGHFFKLEASCVTGINAHEPTNIQGLSFICRWLTDENERIKQWWCDAKCSVQIHLCPVSPAYSVWLWLAVALLDRQLKRSFRKPGFWHQCFSLPTFSFLASPSYLQRKLFSCNSSSWIQTWWRYRKLFLKMYGRAYRCAGRSVFVAIPNHYSTRVTPENWIVDFIST